MDRRTLELLCYGTAGVAVADMALAMGYWGAQGVAPARILRGIAAALVGREAALGGAAWSAPLGAGIHLTLAGAMVAGYWGATRGCPALLRHPVTGGLGWGLMTWAAMMYVVLPLSALGGAGGTDPVWRALHLSSHLFIVGLPSAWLAGRIARGA